MASPSFNSELPPELIEKAKRELHEEPAHKEAHLKSFQRWIDSMPHLTVPDDEILKLAFLRQAKYVHSKAEARLDNFCTLRRSPVKGIPSWFDYPSLDDPALSLYLRSGTVIDLGRTPDGVMMSLFRADRWDPDVLSIDKVRTFGYMNADRIVLDPKTQISGYGMVFDMTNYSMKHMMHVNDRKAMKMEMKIWQESYPFRTKYLIYYNEPIIFDALFKMAEVWLNEKMKSRFIRVKNDIEKAYQKVPGLRELMPKEYGGSNGTIASLAAKTEKEFRDFYSKPSPFQYISVDESKRPPSARNFLREYKDFEGDMLGVKGTYIAFKDED